MMVVAKCANVEIHFRDCPFQTLVVENKGLLRRLTYSFYTEEPETFFVFSQNYEPFEFYQKGFYISSPIHPDFNSKKLLTKINAYLERIANTELHAELLRVKSNLMAFAQRLEEAVDFHAEYNCDISAKDIIKLYNFEIARECMDFAEAFVEHIRLLSRYLGIRLFVVSDLHAVFDPVKLELIFETLLSSEVNILCIEGNCPDSVSPREKLHIIDKDFCEIWGDD